jgi:hypothetical protein
MSSSDIWKGDFSNIAFLSNAYVATVSVGRSLRVEWKAMNSAGVILRLKRDSSARFHSIQMSYRRP